MFILMYININIFITLYLSEVHYLPVMFLSNEHCFVFMFCVPVLHTTPLFLYYVYLLSVLYLHFIHLQSLTECKTHYACSSHALVHMDPELSNLGEPEAAQPDEDQFIAGHQRIFLGEATTCLLAKSTHTVALQVMFKVGDKEKVSIGADKLSCV